MLALISAISVSALLKSVWAFEVIHWEGQLALALSQLPAVIVACTNYPTVDGFLKTLLRLLNLISLLAHKDSYNQTLKLPFTQSRPPAVLGAPVAVAKSSAAPLVPILLLAAILPNLMACSRLAPLPNQSVVCSEQPAQAAAISLVEDVLSSASSSWANDLETLAAQYGLTVVECIVGQLIGDLNSDAGIKTAAVPPIAIDRGQAWLAAHGAVLK